MKKTDMVKLMGEWIAAEYDGDLIKGYSVAKGLLYQQLELGMEPSSIKVKVLTGWTDYGLANYELVDRNEWEEE